MGFLESLKHAFNVGGVNVEVETSDDVHSQNDRVEGRVIVRGGEYERAGNSIELQLKEFWTETRSTGGKSPTTTTVTVYKLHETVPLCGDFVLGSGEERSFDFSVQLPFNARISTSGTGWRLMVVLDIPNAVDPKGSVVLKVEPAEELLAVVEACEEELKFEESERHRHWSSKPMTTYFRLLPPRVIKPALDYLALELRQTEEGGVTGTMIFDLAERSVADYFKAIFNRDQVKKPIHLSRDQLFSGDGEINFKAIGDIVGQDLQEVIRARRL